MKANKSKSKKTTVNNDVALSMTLAPDAFEIERGIEVPNRVRVSKYPWATLDVGDSFFAPIAAKGGSARAYMASKKHGKHFLSRAAVKNGVQGVRFHCVAEPMVSRKSK